MSIDLTLACGEYDLTQALLTGEASPDGIDLNTLTYRAPQRHWRMLKHQEFDVCEMSLASYLAAMRHPEEYPFTAIPVFPHRRFRHSYMFKHSEADVEHPGHLEGKNVGLRTWQSTAGVWMRGIAAEDYGLDLESVTWYIDDTEDVPLDLPDGYDIRQVPDDTDLETMLTEGDLAGAMYPAVLDAVKRPGSGAVRIFEDSVEVEQAYYERTGYFPLMHTVVIRDAVLEDHPWVAANVFRAFERARDICLRKLEDPRWTALAWARQYLEHQQDVLGRNPWPYGMADNQDDLDKLQSYAVDEGFTPSRYENEELFYETTLDEELDKGYVS